MYVITVFFPQLFLCAASVILHISLQILKTRGDFLMIEEVWIPLLCHITHPHPLITHTHHPARYTHVFGLEGVAMCTVPIHAKGRT